MVTDTSPLGCSALLRVAGLPVRYWLAGANPMLFAKLARLERDEETRHACAVQLAERIGQQLVPNPAFSRDDRAFLLTLRRTLHRGDLLAHMSPERLLDVRGVSDTAMKLIQALVAMVERDRQVMMLSAEVEADLMQEQARLLVLPEQIYQESRVAKAFLTSQERDEPTPGSQPGRKSHRHRSEHEWRRIARAATGSTPREWLSHVALLPIEAGVCRAPLAVTEQFTAHWMENVRSRRVALANPPDDWPVPGSRIAVNPLRWDADGCLVCVVVDENREQTQVSVRHTPLLDAICTALAHGVRTFDDLAQALGCVNHDECDALGGFVRHLVTLGILQPSAAPLARLERRAIPGQTFVHLAAADSATGGWVDVYRSVETGISKDLVQTVQAGVLQALRVLSLMRDDTLDFSSLVVPTSERSWTFSEILQAELGVGETATSNREETEPVDGWPFSAPRMSGVAKLASALVERAENAAEVVLDADLLDACGASSGVLNWPVDCLVRAPTDGAEFVAVLDHLRPPGLLDARFADTLADMHGVIPHLEAYRAFLRRLEQLTGILLVEVLVPPLSDEAANAVRRPMYTSAWTGDPHTAPYLRGDADSARYIPLNAILIRRTEGRLRAEVDGQPIWPVCHATRTFELPWQQLMRVLLASAPLDSPLDYRRMNYSLKLLPTLLPERPSVPRISVSGGIVLAPARWRMPSDQLWDRSAPAIAKIRALIRLRNRYSLPRWVYLLHGENKSPVPCDLESIYAIRSIERCATDITPMTLMEMLPAPEQFLVTDRAHHSGDRLASQFQLRFPCDESAAAMASRVAPAVLSALGPSRPQPHGATAPSGGRGPPGAAGLTDNCTMRPLPCE